MVSDKLGRFTRATAWGTTLGGCRHRDRGFFAFNRGPCPLQFRVFDPDHGISVRKGAPVYSGDTRSVFCLCRVQAAYQSELAE